MNEIILQTYGTFILTLAGFVLPIIAIAISSFPEGVKSLRKTYNNEQEQAQKNLEDEIKKQNSSNEADYNLLEENIKKLKSSKARAQKHLLYLNPQYILTNSAIAVGACFCFFLLGIYLFQFNFPFSIILLCLSLVFLVRTLIIFSNSIEIIIEASTAVQDIRRNAEEKTLELLTALVDNSKSGDDSLFIKQECIHVLFHKEEITPDKEYVFSVNKKHTINIKLKNLSDYMLKTVELGFYLPVECLLEGVSDVYTGEKEKIIRFKYNYLQSMVNQHVGDIGITFLKTGTYKLSTFIKSENLKNKNIKFTIKVVD